MFKTTGLFDQVACPEGERCGLPFCIFNHTTQPSAPNGESINRALATKKGDELIDGDRALKKRRVQNSSLDNSEPKLPSDPTRTAQPRTPNAPGQSTPISIKRAVSPPTRKPSLVKRGISIPTKPDLSLPPKPASVQANTNGVVQSTSKPSVKTPAIEQLVPRKLANSPAPFPTRIQLVKLIYAEYIRLNKLVAESNDVAKSQICLSKQDMVTLSLDEEETIAKENPSVYSNVLKLRIKRLRDIKSIDPWKEERLKQIAKANPESAPRTLADVRVDSGLTEEEELTLLPTLRTPITDLAQFGYVPTPPSDEEIEEARRGVETAQHWEQCDRCNSRFQVFPNRRESDGVLTTNGPCKYHWGRQRRPPKSAATIGLKVEDRWTCCSADLGTPGCVDADSHVFKVSDPKRLAMTMQFEETQTTGPETPSSAVAFDCEMGYTSNGLEMIRLTATKWPSGDELVDVLVRPLGEIIDLNSRFSGIWREDWNNAIPYDAAAVTGGDNVIEPPNKKRKASDGRQVNTSSSEPQALKIVSSPQRARQLLFEHLTTTTPLIGHAIDNDLNTARICHPAIIDTVLLFPAQRPLPVRMGLKVLAKKHLGIDIQTGGERGHDSKEDARATGELVRFKVAQKWKDMKARGWKMENGAVVAPPEQ